MSPVACRFSNLSIKRSSLVFRLAAKSETFRLTLPDLRGSSAKYLISIMSSGVSCNS
jgi:hypothetical protein